MRQAGLVIYEIFVFIIKKKLFDTLIYCTFENNLVVGTYRASEYAFMVNLKINTHIVHFPRVLQCNTDVCDSIIYYA